ncbi:hypothetical protein K0M31_012334 [Melipona bicolor]|uniref:Uncharacterized protein n=1 Tax=Melipona bicolor TaxID=60889 RepID=A0AA40KHB6_9HYME|nr:hypothetical protein K0M31_012334 [Melipona bicolor]
MSASTAENLRWHYPCGAVLVFFTRPVAKEFEVAVGDGSRPVKCKLVPVPSKANYCIIPAAPLVALPLERDREQGESQRLEDLATIKKHGAKWHTPFHRKCMGRVEVSDSLGF